MRRGSVDTVALGTARLQRLGAAALGVAMAVPLLVYASVGSFARYTADDYCWAGVLREQGFWQAQVSWYVNYSPRYAFTFLVNLVELAGTSIVPFLPTVAICTWLATLTWTLFQLRVRLGSLSRVVSALLVAELVELATFQTAPDLAQSLYWQTGMLTYVLPLVLATFLIGWIARGAARGAGWGSWLVCGLITFVVGGLSETYLIPQNVAVTLALAGALAVLLYGGARERVLARAAAPHLGGALAGGVLALLAILVAPATAYRVAGTPADLWLASAASIATAAYQAGRLVRYFGPVLVLCLAVPAVLALGQGAESRAQSRRRFVVVTAAVAVLVPFCYFPSFYAQNGNPPARSLIVPGSLLIAYAVYVGVLLRDVPRRAPPVVVGAALTVLALIPLGIAATTLPERAVAAQHAALWDAEDQLIRDSRAAGVRDVVVPPLPPYLGEKFVTPDASNWFNVCVARYYDVRSIAASGEA
jgi:hypothetical protein